MKKIKRVFIIIIKLFLLLPLILLNAILKLFMRLDRANGIHSVEGATGGGKTLKMVTEVNYLTTKQKISLYKPRSWLNIIHRPIKREQILTNAGIKGCTAIPVHLHETFLDLPRFLKMLKKYKIKVVIIDEVSLTWNKRLSKNAEYNKSFMNFMEWLPIHRHSGVKKVYFITQSFDQLDNQIQRVIKYRSLVHTSRVIDLHDYFKRDDFRYKFKPDTIYSFTARKFEGNTFMEQDVKGNMNKVGRVEKYKNIVTLNDLESYDTHYFKNLLDDIENGKTVQFNNIEKGSKKGKKSSKKTTNAAA